MSTEPPVQISVVLPTHNRRDLLGRCLDSLAAQTQPPDSFEVIVVVDGSDDDTAEMLERLEAPFRLRPILPGRVGQSAARNAGIEAARGGVCLLLDDDIIASPELVAEHRAAHQADDRLIGIGALEQQPPADADWYAEAFASSWAEHYRGLATRPVTWRDCYGGNLSARRSDLVAIDGFASDISISKDIELGFRLERHGCVARYLPRAHALHDDQKPRSRLLRDVRLQGSGYIDLAEKHPEMRAALLGWFGAGSSRELALRRLLIALRASPEAVARLAGLGAGRRHRMLAYEFVRKFAFWLAVRKRLSRRRWLELTRTAPAAAEGPERASPA